MTEIANMTKNVSEVDLRLREKILEEQEEALTKEELVVNKAIEVDQEAEILGLEIAAFEEEKRMMIAKILETGREIAKVKRKISRRDSENIPPRLK